MKKVNLDPICPVCGEVCSDVYTDFLGRVVGCDVCLDKRDAYEELVLKEIEA